jgi:hypothetical protein
MIAGRATVRTRFHLARQARPGLRLPPLNGGFRYFAARSWAAGSMSAVRLSELGQGCDQTYPKGYQRFVAGMVDFFVPAHTFSCPYAGEDKQLSSGDESSALPGCDSDIYSSQFTRHN